MFLNIVLIALSVLCFFCAGLMACCGLVVYRFKWVATLLAVICGVFIMLGCTLWPI